MKKKLIIFVAFVVVLMMMSPVIAGAPTATLTVNGVPVELQQEIVSSGSGNDIEQVYELSSPVITDDYQIMSVMVNFKQDPHIDYVIGVIDTGAPTSFSFTFNSPINPVIVGPNNVHSSMSLSTTDGGSNGVRVTALAPPAGIPVDGDGVTELQVTTVYDGSVRQNIGLDLGGPGILLPNPPQSSTWGPFNEGFVPGPVSVTGWNDMQINVNFRGSGGGDVYSLNGRSDIVQPSPSPEFPTMALPAAFIVGLIGAVLYIRRTEEN
jgi:hypothetical protein